jgi:hypothetical protein
MTASTEMNATPKAIAAISSPSNRAMDSDFTAKSISPEELRGVDCETKEKGVDVVRSAVDSNGVVGGILEAVIAVIVEVGKAEVVIEVSKVDIKISVSDVSVENSSDLVVVLGRVGDTAVVAKSVKAMTYSIASVYLTSISSLRNNVGIIPIFLPVSLFLDISPSISM